MSPERLVQTIGLLGVRARLQASSARADQADRGGRDRRRRHPRRSRRADAEIAARGAPPSPGARGSRRATAPGRPRLRPNIVIAGVDGLAERGWLRRRLRIGGAVIQVAKLRGRCVMTTYDPDTQEQDLSVLQRTV